MKLGHSYLTDKAAPPPEDNEKTGSDIRRPCSAMPRQSLSATNRSSRQTPSGVICDPSSLLAVVPASVRTRLPAPAIGATFRGAR